MRTALVYGVAVAGAASIRAMRQRGIDVIAADDEMTPARTALADELGVELVAAPSTSDLNAMLARVDVLVPAPGVPESHHLFDLAAGSGTPVMSEIELAYRWEQDHPGGPRPMLAITGTDGKTTTTLLAVAMLEAAGVRAVAAGNTDVPLVSALDLDVDAFVVECTSFRLAWTSTFRGEGAVWLNLAPDHLNWHRAMSTYVAAKGRIFAHQRPGDVAIGYASDAEVMHWLRSAPARHVTFGGSHADYRRDGDTLVGPAGPIAPVQALRRQLPHDVSNGLAAAALVLETGLADADAVAGALATFVGPPHRIELVGEIDGVRYYNDSKATTPHAASAAISAFEHVVLIAGGKNKGLDLSPMAAAAGERLRAVVAIGESADEVAALFGPRATVHRASSMPDAIDVAGAAARPGDVVLLSPGCASFDWYRDFEAWGDDFRAIVHDLAGRKDRPMSTSSTREDRGPR